MPFLPRSDAELVSMLTTLIAAWEPDPTLVGLQATDINQMESARDALQTLIDEATEIRNQSKIVTEAKTTAADDARETAATKIATIRAFADEQPNPKAVLTTAQLPQRKEPAPRPAPDMPTNLAGRLNNSGEVVLTWDGSRANGVTFLIERANPAGEGESPIWSVLNTVQQNQFTDANIPVSSSAMVYRVKAMRGGLSSEFSEWLTVAFGSTGASESQSGGSMSVAA